MRGGGGGEWGESKKVTGQWETKSEIRNEEEEEERKRKKQGVRKY